MTYKFMEHVTAVYFMGAQQPPLGQGLLIYEVSRSHSPTDHSR